MAMFHVIRNMTTEMRRIPVEFRSQVLSGIEGKNSFHQKGYLVLWQSAVKKFRRAYQLSCRR